MDTKILVGIAILVIFVVIIGILMMKNKDSYTAPPAPTIPSATADPGWVFTEAGMNFLLSPQGGLAPSGITDAPNTWMKSAAWVNWVNWYVSFQQTLAENQAGNTGTPGAAEYISAMEYMQNKYPGYIAGLLTAYQNEMFKRL